MKALILNILYFPNQFGGAEKITQLIAEGLHKLGVETVVVSLSRKAGMDIVNGVKVYYLPLKNIFFPFMREYHPLAKMLWHLVDLYNPLMAREVGKIIDNEKPDLVNTNVLAGFSVGTWSAIKSRGLPIIHTLHDHYLLCPRSTMFNNGGNCLSQCWQCRIFSFPKRGPSALVDGAVGVSSYILQRHCEAGYFPTAIRKTIYNPIPQRKVTIKSARKGKMRFGYIGRLGQYKGVEDLLQAFTTIDPQKASLKVAGTGDSAYVTLLQKQYGGGTNIAFLGFVPADEFYNQIDVLVVPSRCHDSLPTVILEAYSHGLPVIAAKRGGIPEIVDEGRTGFLFEPDNPGELANQLRKFLEGGGLALEMSLNCLKKAEEFSPANTISQYNELYKSL
jgi:glycosyltransferase involved in cell wall biosynthesis